MKVLFAGTPDIAVPTLEALHGAHEVVAVLCAPDAPQGRSTSLVPCPVKARAESLGLRVFSPEKLDQSARELASGCGAEILVCFAYGKIFGPRFLGLFPRGGLNIHPSLLPDLRGPSPIASAIWLGRKRTGLTVQTLAAEMDAGDIVVQVERELDGSETAGSLGDWAAAEGSRAILEALDVLERGYPPPRPQDAASATWCRLLAKEDGILDWSLDARSIERSVRAFDPWPRASTTWQGQGLAILEASWREAGSEAPAAPGTVLGMDKKEGILVQTGSGLLLIRRLQLQGKKPMDAAAFMNGARGFVGSRLGEA